ncbi:hypothetical protein BY996DRAFT_6440000 [Phakopsora pachyrhizi]|nr:hypothetical protein BY996DRAFT_6440000 [Phakopsora pachyrhizi]
MPPKTSARGRYPLRVSLRARNIPPFPADNSKAGQKPRNKTSPGTQGVAGEVSSRHRTTKVSNTTSEERTNVSLKMELEQASSKEARRHLPPTPYTKTIPGLLLDTPNPGNELQGCRTHKDITIGLKKPGNKSHYEKRQPSQKKSKNRISSDILLKKFLHKEKEDRDDPGVRSS